MRVERSAITRKHHSPNLTHPICNNGTFGGVFCSCPPRVNFSSIIVCHLQGRKARGYPSKNDCRQMWGWAFFIVVACHMMSGMCNMMMAKEDEKSYVPPLGLCFSTTQITSTDLSRSCFNQIVYTWSLEVALWPFFMFLSYFVIAELIYQYN